MYKLTDLFDKRSAVGAKLEQILVEKDYTKALLCKKSGVSRPTIDKLLAGMITNKTNYEKHIEKILTCLEITPDILMGNIEYRHNRTRTVRSIRHISSEEISEATGISLERLRSIESGDEASVTELQDIAVCLDMGTNDLLGLNYFEPQIATLNYFLEFNEDNEMERLSGFWGHFGILPNNMDEYYWFPITGNTREFIYSVKNQEQMVVPCMNNKVLLLNMKNIKNMILLGEDCDAPAYANWDSNVSCGELPMVVYEAIEDYFYIKDDKEERCHFSAKLLKGLDELVKKNGWTEDTAFDMTNLSTIYYADGKQESISIDFDGNEDISCAVSVIYEFGQSFERNILCLEDTEGVEKLLNMENVSMLELPLIKVEKAIRDSLDDIELK